MLIEVVLPVYAMLSFGKYTLLLTPVVGMLRLDVPEKRTSAPVCVCVWKVPAVHTKASPPSSRLRIRR